MLDILFIVALIDAYLVILSVLIPRRWCYFVYREICKADKKNKEKTDEWVKFNLFSNGLYFVYSYYNT